MSLWRASLVAGWLIGAPAALAAGTLVQFRSIAGDVEVELFDQAKPVTVRNFIRYVQGNHYQNTFFHRCVPGFVLQGGGFTVAAPTSTNSFLDPIPVPSFGNITNEFGVGPFISNTNWTIALAKRSGDPNSASSQWFFNLANNAAGDNNLDTQNGGFTVFGRVVRGTNVLQQFNNLNYFFGIVDLGWWWPPTNFLAVNFPLLPVNYPGGAYPRYSDLIYVDITLLNVRVALVPGAREISWNSISGKTNVVEFTTAFPPVWQTLAATNGTGVTLAVRDASTNQPARFYRVRVVY